MKKNNSGFSLVELVVVIAVMAVIMAVGGAWFTRMSGYRVRECTSKITNGLTQAKVLSMSKSVNTGDVYWKLEKDNGLYYATTYVTKTVGGSTTVESEDRVKVGKSNNIKVIYYENGTGTEVGATNDLRIAYKRNTGEIYRYNGSAWQEAPITKIEVTNGNKSYEINVVAKTGKISGRN